MLQVNDHVQTTVLRLRYLSAFGHRIVPILEPMRKSSMFSLSAIHIITNVDTYYTLFSVSRNGKIKTRLAEIQMNRLAVL